MRQRLFVRHGTQTSELLLAELEVFRFLLSEVPEWLLASLHVILRLHRLGTRQGSPLCIVSSTNYIKVGEKLGTVLIQGDVMKVFATCDANIPKSVGTPQPLRWGFVPKKKTLECSVQKFLPVFDCAWWDVIRYSGQWQGCCVERAWGYGGVDEGEETSLHSCSEDQGRCGQLQ